MRPNKVETGRGLLTTDCSMVPYGIGDHFCARFSILPLCEVGSRSLLIGYYLANCYLATSIFCEIVVNNNYYYCCNNSWLEN